MDTKRPLIIVDIDNTILNNDKRKQAILKERLERKIGLSEIRREYNLTRILADKKVKEQFWHEFFSGDYLSYDMPVRSAATVLSHLARQYDIAYVTGRHDDPEHNDSMRQATINSLRKYGFPMNRRRIELYFKDKRATPDSVFKENVIKSLVAGRREVWGIGDTPEDLKLYSIFGVRPIGILTPYFDSEQLARGLPQRPVIANNWSKVREAIRLERLKSPSRGQAAS